MNEALIWIIFALFQWVYQWERNCDVYMAFFFFFPYFSSLIKAKKNPHQTLQKTKPLETCEKPFLYFLSKELSYVDNH